MSEFQFTANNRPDMHNGRSSEFSSADRFTQNISFDRRQHNNQQPIQEFIGMHIVF
jgi:hypothetical protein